MVENDSLRPGGPKVGERLTVMRIKLAFFILTLMALPAAAHQQLKRNLSSADLLDEFKNEKVFWKQFEIAKKIVALHDTTVLSDLAGWLNHDDRHTRGNV